MEKKIKLGPVISPQMQMELYKSEGAKAVIRECGKNTCVEVQKQILHTGSEEVVRKLVKVVKYLSPVAVALVPCRPEGRETVRQILVQNGYAGALWKLELTKEKKEKFSFRKGWFKKMRKDVEKAHCVIVKHMSFYDFQAWIEKGPELLKHEMMAVYLRKDWQQVARLMQMQGYSMSLENPFFKK